MHSVLQTSRECTVWKLFWVDPLQPGEHTVPCVSLYKILLEIVFIIQLSMGVSIQTEARHVFRRATDSAENRYNT